MKRIDVFNHFMPSAVCDAWSHYTQKDFPVINYNAHDLSLRKQDMQNYGEDYQQILTLGATEPLELVPGPAAQELARIANDSMVQIVAENPDMIRGGIATISLDNIDEALKELERACNQLGLRGVMIGSHYKGTSVADPRFFPIYQYMAELDLPVMLHPVDGPHAAHDGAFSWLMETSWLMIDLATSGIFEMCPDIKFVTHHCGALIPVWHNRIRLGHFHNKRYAKKPNDKSPEEYFANLRKFYGDTALYGDCTAGLEAGVAFFGTDHVMFGTDYPLDGRHDLYGNGQVKEIMDSIERMRITDSQRCDIFENNALRVFKL